MYEQRGNTYQLSKIWVSRSFGVFDLPLEFRNWKKATEREGGFSLHTKSDRHNQTIIAWKDYQRAVKGNATLENH